MTAPPVAESWHRIDTWLAAHAPASLALLNPPASGDDVRRAEDAIGLRFPADLTASLAVHDGLAHWADLLPGAAPLSAARIASTWQVWTNEHEPDDEDDEPWWDPRWLPWAETASGDAHVIDLRPGAGHGRVGLAVHDDRATFDHAWPSLAAYLGAVAHALTHGVGVEGLFPDLTDGELRWTR